MIRAIRVSHRKAKGATCRARARKGLTRESNKPPRGWRWLHFATFLQHDVSHLTDVSRFRRFSALTHHQSRRQPRSVSPPVKGPPAPARHAPVPARCDACLPHAWPPRLVARIRTDERVPRGLLPGVRPQLSTAPRPRTMHMTTTDSLEHDKRSHQTNNRRFKPVPVRTHHSHTRTNSRSSVVATEHTPAN